MKSLLKGDKKLFLILTQKSIIKKQEWTLVVEGWTQANLNLADHESSFDTYSSNKIIFLVRIILILFRVANELWDFAWWSDLD